jgi:hypothetical protein
MLLREADLAGRLPILSAQLRRDAFAETVTLSDGVTGFARNTNLNYA